MRLSHVIHYRHISTKVCVIIRVIYNNTRSLNIMLKCISESLIVTNYESHLLQSLDISLLITKIRKIFFLKLLVLFYVVNLYPVIKLKITQLQIQVYIELQI